MKLLEHIAKHNNVNPSIVIPLYYQNVVIGAVQENISQLLKEECKDVFIVLDTHILINPNISSIDLFFFMKKIALILHEKYNIIPPLRGENLSVFPLNRVSEILSTENDANTILQSSGLFEIDRNATSPFGIVTFGVMLNCFTRNKDGSLSMWIAQRSLKKPIHQYPGKLDPIIGGAVEAGVSPRQALIKEAWEECSMPKYLAEKAVFKGFVSYLMRQYGGIKFQILFCYDLDLSGTKMPFWQPRVNDKSIEKFFLMSAQEVADRLRYTDDFKGGSNLIKIDFLIRNNIIRKDEKFYKQIKNSLRNLLLPFHNESCQFKVVSVADIHELNLGIRTLIQ